MSTDICSSFLFRSLAAGGLLLVELFALSRVLCLLVFRFATDPGFSLRRSDDIVMSRAPAESGRWTHFGIVSNGTFIGQYNSKGPLQSFGEMGG